MATVTVGTIIGRANTLLNDPGFIRWPKQELLDYYNDATRAIVLVRPDANVASVAFTCVAGTKQQLPSNALKLLDVVRNAGGHAIRYVDRAAIDANYPDWHSGNTATKVEAYCLDERSPKVFYLYPGPAAGVDVDIVYSVAPVAKTLDEVESVATPAVADLDDIYINPLLDWIMYRAFSKDAEWSANGNRATAHYQAYSDQLGLKTQVDQALEQRKDAQFSRGAR